MSSKGVPPQAASSASGSRPLNTGGRLDLAIAVRPALLRDVLTRLLEQVPDLRVVGYGENEDQIRDAVSKHHPGLVLFDYEAMGPNGEAIISHLRRAAPKTRILVIARRSDETTVEGVLRAGASGLVGKEEGFETLVRAIRLVMKGELWANRRMAAQVLERLTGASPLVPALEGLTRRELEIVECVGLGLRNKEIAHRLKLSESTVKSHLNMIFRRLKVQGRVALAMLSQERNQPKD